MSCWNAYTCGMWLKARLFSKEQSYRQRAPECRMFASSRAWCLFCKQDLGPSRAEKALIEITARRNRDRNKQILKVPFLVGNSMLGGKFPSRPSVLDSLSELFPGLSGKRAGQSTFKLIFSNDLLFSKVCSVVMKAPVFPKPLIQVSEFVCKMIVANQLKDLLFVARMVQQRSQNWQ